MRKQINLQQVLFTIFFSLQAFSCLGVNYNPEFEEWIVGPRCNDRTSTLCHGYYLEPSYPFPLNDTTEHPTKITSDHGEFVNKGTSIFYGKVVIEQGNKTLKADKATITHNADSGDLEVMHAEGNTKITEPDLRVDGTSAIIYEQEDKKIIYDPIYRMYPRHARGTADTMTIEKQQTILTLPNASYTTCAPANNTWFMRARKTKFNKDTGRGEAWHSWLYIKNFKVFYWPYINFPIDSRRQTGFLMPSAHSGSSNGFSIDAPFYWNLAPNYDAIITPHLMAKRGAKIDSHFRYLTEHSSGNIKFNFLPDDKGYQSFRNKRLAEPTSGIGTQDPRYIGLRDINTRYSFAINDKTKFNKQFKSEIEYTKIGDDNYIFDFDGDIMQQNFPMQTTNPNQPGGTIVQPGVTTVQPGTTTPNYSATTSVRQKFELQHSSHFGTLTSKLEQYQILHPYDGPESAETFRQLPAVDFQSSTFDLPQDFAWNFSSNYTQFKIRNTAFRTATAVPSTGERYHIQPGLEHQCISPGWFIKPSVLLDTTSYKAMKLSPDDLRNNKIARATRNIPIYSIDSGLIFERPLNISKTAFLQTLEPRAFYLYTAKRDQSRLPNFDSGMFGMDYNQVFRKNRYSGFDRIADANQLGIGVMSRFLTDQANEEKASIGVGRILYFQDRINHLEEQIDNTAQWSPIAGVAKYQILPEWNVEANLVKEKLNKTNSGSLNLQYITDPSHVVNFGYQFVRNDIFDTNTGRPTHLRTVQTSSAWEVKPQLRLLGRIAHDLNLSRVTNALFGIEKHDCCTIFRIVWIRNIKSMANLTQKQYENAISLQFVLKGLTHSGDIDTNRISNAIPGYVTKDHEF